jgi:hypothetical protein
MKAIPLVKALTGPMRPNGRAANGAFEQGSFGQKTSTLS